VQQKGKATQNSVPVVNQTQTQISAVQSIRTLFQYHPLNVHLTVTVAVGMEDI